MSRLQDVESWLNERLEPLLNEHGVPGASVAAFADESVVVHAGGLLNMSTGVRATTDSIFQIGSITKVLTATLAMRLVERGLLDLDAPVRQYLPDFRVADEDSSRAIVVRQLTCHTAGFEGDTYAPIGWGDDVIRRNVELSAGAPQIFPPGSMFSYSNLGFTVLGRIIEVLCDMPFDDCLRRDLLKPLGLEYASPTPWDAILHRAAVGHIGGRADLRPAPVYSYPRSDAPAGAVLAMRAEDLLAFGQMHLREGLSPTDSPVLDRALVAAMQQPQVALPKFHGSWLLGDHWGIGWTIHDLPGGPVFAHGGETIGQMAFLALVPRANVAIAVLTNGGAGDRIRDEIAAFALRELAGVKFPGTPSPRSDLAITDAIRYVGDYSYAHGDATVRQDGEGRFWITRTPKGPFLELYELLGEEAAPQTAELLAFDGDILLAIDEDADSYTPIAFLGDDGYRRAQYVQSGLDGRAIRRVDG